MGWATKKPLELTPVRNQIVLWTFDTPYGVGIRSNGLLAGFLTSNGENSITGFQPVSIRVTYIFGGILYISGVSCTFFAEI